MQYCVGCYMDQIAGHITNYRNLKSVVEKDPELKASWHELHYYKNNGLFERLHEKVLPFLPGYPTGVLRGAFEMLKALKNYRQYDAILTNASVGIFFSRYFRKIPTLIDFDCTPLQLDRMKTYGSGKDDSKPVAALKWKLFRSKMDAAALLQAWSNWAKNSAVEDYGLSPNKIVVNPPGVNLDFWQPGLVAKPLATNEPLKVLFVGADFRRKGGLLLLEWFKQQNPGKYELHLVTKEDVPSTVGVTVYQDMRPNSPELLHLYQTSHLFVLPSLGECFGIANIEAMAAGLPVIASDVGGIADIIEPGENGFIIPADDLNALTKAISTITENNALRIKMARKSRQLAEERFDLQRNAQRTLDLLKQIAKK